VGLGDTTVRPTIAARMPTIVRSHVGTGALLNREASPRVSIGMMPYVITRAHPAGERDPAATTSTKACSSTEVYLSGEAGPKMITDTGLRDSTEAQLNREAGPKTFDRSM
jgi:hypothetical protein